MFGMMVFFLMSGVIMLSGVDSILGLNMVMMYLFSVFKHDLGWFLSYGQFFLIDSMSLLLILLSVWISMFMILSMNFGGSKNMSNLLSGVILLLMMFLAMAFSVSNFVNFYIFFEASVIPTLILILGWGYQPERIGAGFYLVLYTVAASLPFFCALLSMLKSGVAYAFLNDSLNLGGFLSDFLFITCFLAFLVKLPVYMLHLWLPKAHVEAPVGGSMILAGLLLKLGGYGMIRLVKVVGNSEGFMSSLSMSWALYGGMVVGFLCLRQSDVKSLIALSSVVHMGIIVGGVLIRSVWGYGSVILVMVGHGLCSSGLFCTANMIYKWVGSRSMGVVKGAQIYVPMLSMVWFLLCSSNMSAPPSLSLLGEVSGSMGIVSWSWWFILIMIMVVFLTGAYSLYLYLSVIHGKGATSVLGWGMNIGDLILILLHWVPLNTLFMVYMYCVMSTEVY